MNKLINSYTNLPLNEKREVLLNEIKELLDTIEKICLKRNLDITKLKSKEYLKNKDKLLEEDYYDLLYLYTIFIKEDLAIML